MIVQQVTALLPATLQKIILNLPPEHIARMEEIRLRAGRPLAVRLADRDYWVGPTGAVVENTKISYIITASDVQQTLQLLSAHSIYALEEELRNGFITIPGGLRVGLAGKAVLEGGQIRTLKDISGLNIRISRQIIGAADKIIGAVLDPRSGRLHNTIIIAAPRAGKTTLLRDLIRQLSNGAPGYRFPGLNVGLVDERSEVAACYAGMPQMDVGLRTDVLDGCPKAQGMMLMIRAMGPQVVATDEIGRAEDAQALEEALYAGIAVVTTAHGFDLHDFINRPNLRLIWEKSIFKRIIILGRRQGAGTVEGIYDEKGQPVLNLAARGWKQC